MQKGGQVHTIGRSRSGLLDKIVNLVDTLGDLVRSFLLPGQADDIKGIAPLIKEVSFEALLADETVDADWLLKDLNKHGAPAVILPKANHTVQR